MRASLMFAEMFDSVEQYKQRIRSAVTVSCLVDSVLPFCQRNASPGSYYLEGSWLQ